MEPPVNADGRRRRGDLRSSAFIGGFSLFFLLSVFPASAAAGQRIVSLAPSITEAVFALGAGDDLVGVTDFCDWPPPARRIDRIGSYLKPNVEAVVARRPDLVIVVPTPGNREAVESLEHLGLRIVVVAEGPTLADVLAAIRTIAAETGRREVGEQLIADMQARIAALRSRIGEAKPRRVLVIVGRRPLVAAGDGTLVDELVRLAGGENVAVGLGPWPRLSVEHLVRSAPEVVLDSAMGDEAGADLSFYEGLGLAAVKRGTVHAIRIDEVLRPGPRLPEGIEKLARRIHPEAFR